ncbi:mannose-6-phosphate isomerase [Lewinella marina]|uniref:mannose-6-phosphate isomerase, class I n=1 Tax=Neolewinella marina TaxID=438751 RepID=UPI001431F5CB|nr:mannose-6-phosphate isomerase, class I [Neolewinella marina]NJB85178.1 mannose-6-phosphate isomerase [Neolewinella marina]
MPNLYPFDGVIQHYAWGGYEYLPSLLHADNPDHQPWAELWMGAHEKGPGRLRDAAATLAEVIQKDPTGVLGEAVAQRFDQRLPFLFKILDVREMLSIQVHPTKQAAEEGFAEEERNGPARDAPDRNYRDDNHKPELGVALTDFYLLHGFRSPEAIRATLADVPGWDGLIPTLDEGGTEALYAHVMGAEQAEIDQLLTPLAEEVRKGNYHRDQPRFWAQRAVEQYTDDGHHDRGMFSIFWFNLVKLTPGQGIFQDAGIPHAYLEGCCIELMANSDNVLRGGLTPKHIDVEELLKHTDFQAVEPNPLAPQAARGPWKIYPTPAPDFSLSTARVKAGYSLPVEASDAPGILLLMSGALEANGTRLTEEQRTVFVPAGSSVDWSCTSDAVVYWATVGTIK